MTQPLNDTTGCPGPSSINVTRRCLNQRRAARLSGCPYICALMVYLASSCLASFCLASCGGSGTEPAYDGDPGQAAAFISIAEVPAVAGRVVSRAFGTLDGNFIVDTGSPLSLISRHAKPSATTGWQELRLETMHLGFDPLHMGVIDLFGDTACAEASPVGLVGADVLGHFTVELDYRAGSITLHDTLDDLESLATKSGAAVDTIPMEVLGGGRVSLPGSTDSRRVAASRLLLPISIDQGPSITAMIDTGATASVIRQGSLPALSAGTRPRACCLEVNTFAGVQRVSAVRIKELHIGSTSLINSWVLELPKEVFDALSKEVGKPIDALLGGNALRAFASRIHYRHDELELSPYTETPHIDPDPWLLPGFTSCKSKDGSFVVLDVFDGTEAKKQGVVAGASLVEVDGQSVLTMDLSQLLERVRQRTAGSKVTLTFAGSSGPLKVEVPVERVLARFPQ